MKIKGFVCPDKFNQELCVCRSGEPKHFGICMRGETFNNIIPKCNNEHTNKTNSIVFKQAPTFQISLMEWNLTDAKI